MYLRRIRLTNIRCFKDVEIDFDLDGGKNRKWTVLLGENGTGKSTVLKAIGLLMAGSDALADLVDEPGAWVRKGEEKGRIEGQIETKEGEVRDLSLEFVQGERFSIFLNRAEKTLEPLNSALAHADRNYPIFAYGASRRLSPKRRSRSKDFYRSRARSMASLFTREAELNDLEDWAMELDYRSDGKQMDIVRTVLSEFLPELTFSHIDKDKGALLFKTEDGMVPLESLSDGYQNVAAWVGDLLYHITQTFEDYNNPLHVRGLLVIDEVDLHLHPKWQRILLDFLNEQLPQMQLVVTTHSVVTAQQTPEDSLFYSSRQKGSAPQILAFEGDPRTMLLHQLFVTEAFGHMSDESIHVEEAKDEYRKLHRKRSKTERDKEKMEKLAAEIPDVDDDPRDRIVMTDKQRALFKKLSEEQSAAS